MEEQRKQDTSRDHNDEREEGSTEAKIRRKGKGRGDSENVYKEGRERLRG